jgi:hypothetical protein
MCAPRPTATGPGHSRARCDAWPARAQCDESGDRAEWRLRRSRDPRAHSPGAAAVVPIRGAAEESHPPTPGLLASRSGWRRSGARRAVRPPVANQMALAPALGPIGRIRNGLVTAVHRADATTVHDRPRPINLEVLYRLLRRTRATSVERPRSLRDGPKARLAIWPWMIASSSHVIGPSSVAQSSDRPFIATIRHAGVGCSSS